MYVAVEVDLATIDVEETGTCVVIRQRYDVGPDPVGTAPFVDVVQERGCRASVEAPPPAGIEDPNWIVGIFGDPTEVDRLTDDLIRYDLDGAALATGSPILDADAFLDGWLDEQTGVFEATEIARFAHRDGLVSAFRRETAGRDGIVTNTIAFGTPPEVGPARMLNSCSEYTSGASEGGDDGYAWFAATDPATTIDVRLTDGTLFRVPLEPVADEVSFGSVDRGSVPVRVENSTIELVVHDLAGDEIPCT